MLKRDSNTGVLLWILRNMFKNNYFEGHLRTAASIKLYSWIFFKSFCWRFLEDCWFLRFLALVKACQKQPPEVFCKKGVLKNFTKFTGKHLCQSHRTPLDNYFWHVKDFFYSVDFMIIEISKKNLLKLWANYFKSIIGQG